jgi:hypothetical protein
MLHHQGHDQVLFVQKFIDELKPEIRNAIMLHKPRTIDSAMSLAIMQGRCWKPLERGIQGSQYIIVNFRTSHMCMKRNAFFLLLL